MTYQFLVIQQLYTSVNSVVIGNVNSLSISNTRDTKVDTQNNFFHLGNVLHALKLSSNLIYMQQFYLDKNIFIEFHSDCLYVKDNLMRTLSRVASYMFVQVHWQAYF